MDLRFKGILGLLLLIATTVSAALLATTGTEDDNLEIMVISDTHLMAPQLLKEEGKAFDDYIARDRKMLTESPALMQEMTDIIIDKKPKAVFIVGDLTKDGETASHLYIRDNYLSRMREEGIDVYVIPGNHDVDNPHAVEFLGEKTRRVPTPKAEEFAEIYADYGYGRAIARDKHSLSYVAQIADHTRLLCIDACKYEENSYGKNTCVTGGRIKPETIKFIKQQAKDAKHQGMRLLCMMHHGAIEHWKWQEKAMGEYLVDDWKKVASMLEKQGVEVVFTGHFHAHDIVGRGSLYDIETGSIVSYPSPYREVSLKGGNMTIKSHHLEGKGLAMPEGMTLDEYAQKFAASGVNTIIGRILPKDTPGALRDSVCGIIGEAYVAHLRGDEKMPAGKDKEIRQVAAQLRQHSWKLSYIFRHAVSNLWNDPGVEDNDVELVLSR